MQKKTLRLSGLACVLILTSPAWADCAYTTIDLSGARSTEVNGVNDAGQLTGNYLDAGGVTRGFVGTQFGFGSFDASTSIAAAVPGTSSFVAINAGGAAIGTYMDSSGLTRGFMMTPTLSFMASDVPGSGGTIPSGLNASGQIVGSFIDGAASRGYLWADGSYKTLEFAGVTKLSVNGINDAGQLVGTFVSSNGERHGFYTAQGALTQVDVPGAAVTLLAGIDNAGAVIGLYRDAAGNHGFLLAGGRLTVLAMPGAAATYPNGLSGNGQIAGSYRDTAGTLHGFSALCAR